MRFKFLRVCYFILMALVIIRLWYWQIYRSDDLVARAEGQRLTSNEIEADRGEILFSDGSVLASTQPSFLIFAQPKLIKDPTLLAKSLAEAFFDMDNPNNTDEEFRKSQTQDIQQKIYDRITQNLYWVSLNKIVNFDHKKKLEALNLDGIGFQQQSERFYPEGSSSAHLLGFVGSDTYGNPTGYFGLEGFYNGELKGRNGVVTQEKDAHGLPILIGKFLSKDPQQGKTLTLSINRSIQHIVEDKLKLDMDKFGAKSAQAIVMDPKTGNILAMAAYPNYDPSNVTVFPKENFKDSAIADSYEPGSTFKPLIMSAAINEHLVTPDTKCDNCSGPVAVGGYQIHTWNDKYFPNTNMSDVIINSDNTGMVFVSSKLGLDKEYQYIKNFGFGELTGVDLQDEAFVDLRPKDQWHDIDVATASFGQGIAVTPIQLIRAIATIANGGYLMEPHVVSQIKDSGGTVDIKPRVLGRPVSTDVAKQMTDIMVQEVDKGEAKFYKKFEGVDKFLIAGKTGTAQIPVAGHYDPTKTIASFVGFAPANDPKYILLVKYDQPTASIYGAETAAPTFFEISKELFNYFGIAPTEQ